MELFRHISGNAIRQGGHSLCITSDYCTTPYKSLRKWNIYPQEKNASTIFAEQKMEGDILEQDLIKSWFDDQSSLALWTYWFPSGASHCETQSSSQSRRSSSTVSLGSTFAWGQSSSPPLRWLLFRLQSSTMSLGSTFAWGQSSSPPLRWLLFRLQPSLSASSEGEGSPKFGASGKHAEACHWACIVSEHSTQPFIAATILIDFMLGQLVRLKCVLYKSSKCHRNKNIYSIFFHRSQGRSNGSPIQSLICLGKDCRYGHPAPWQHWVSCQGRENRTDPFGSHQSGWQQVRSICKEPASLHLFPLRLIMLGTLVRKPNVTLFRSSILNLWMS